MRLRHLRAAAHVELASLTLLLANLATVHLQPVAALLGPLHGCAYLFVLGAAWRAEPATPAARAVAFVPGVGGLLAWRRLNGPRPAD